MYAYEMYAHEVHAYKMHAHEMYESGNFDLSLSMPSPYAGALARLSEWGRRSG
jgi:hypothetical protein